jgi:shikimate dehydrogenase
MWPHNQVSIWPESEAVPSHLTIFDLVYNPRETRLLQQASEGGAKTIGGLGMLVAQGALAFEIWTGHQPPISVMLKACQNALAEQAGGANES